MSLVIFINIRSSCLNFIRSPYLQLTSSLSKTVCQVIPGDISRVVTAGNFTTVCGILVHLSSDHHQVWLQWRFSLIRSSLGWIITFSIGRSSSISLQMRNTTFFSYDIDGHKNVGYYILVKAYLFSFLTEVRYL